MFGMLPRKIVVPLVVVLIIVVIISVIALSGNQEPEDNTPPGKVSGLNAVDLRDGRILLVWNAAQDDVEVAFYNVFRDTNKLEKRPSVPMTVDDPGDVRAPTNTESRLWTDLETKAMSQTRSTSHLSRAISSPRPKLQASRFTPTITS
ncbi:MAG: hypothetical protein LN417_06515 [Candidatus Thermoplasmatota archaeon]|nr:hypothetical protein [Candidatus Thermoplasmatota archaeon]